VKEKEITIQKSCRTIPRGRYIHYGESLICVTELYIS
jgi:hypothetical protein